MSTPADQLTLDDGSASPSGVLSALQAPPASPEGRAWGENYLKEHPQGVDTTGEASLLQDYASSAEEARAALRQARERLAQQRLDPRILGYSFAQAMLSPSKGGVPDNWSNAAGAMANFAAQNQQFEQNKATQDLSLAEQLADADKGSLSARLSLQQMRERLQSAMMNTALRATAKPTTPQVAPHYSMVEHDVTMPDGSPGKQTYMVDSSTGTVKPYGDPAPTVKGAGLDARSGIMFQRVLSSANEASTAIKNITELPTGASSGIFGVGASPGHSLLESAKGVLTNKLAPQEVQDYMTMLPGLGRNLATIETSGLAPQGSLTDSFNTLQIRDGDTGYTKLHKLAEYRQILEKGIETNLSNPKIPQEQKDAVQRIIDSTRDAIPFTQSDVTALEKAHASHPEMTMRDYLQSQGLGKRPAAAAPQTATTLPPAAVAKLQEGFNTTFANGQKWTLHNGQPVQVQ